MCSFLTPSEKSSPWGRLSSIIWSIKHPKPQTSAAKPYSPGQQTVDGLSIFQNGLAGGLEQSGIESFTVSGRSGLEMWTFELWGSKWFSLWGTLLRYFRCHEVRRLDLTHVVELHGIHIQAWKLNECLTNIDPLQSFWVWCRCLRAAADLSAFPKDPTWSELLVFSGCDSQQLNFKIIQDTLKKGLKRYKQIILVVSIETSPNPRKEWKHRHFFRISWEVQRCRTNFRPWPRRSLRALRWLRSASLHPAECHIRHIHACIYPYIKSYSYISYHILFYSILSLLYYIISYSIILYYIILFIDP